MSAPLCIDCRFYRKDSLRQARCYRLEVGARLSPVDGKADFYMLNPQDERAGGEFSHLKRPCGPSGRYFQAKPS